MSENVPDERDEKFCTGLKERTYELMRMTGRVTVRAHHILCCFCAYGETMPPYSLLPKVTEEMQTNPDLEIRIVAGHDDVCYCCPDFRNNRCVGGEGKMAPGDMQKDLDVLRRLRLVSGAVLPAKELFGMIAEKIPHVVDICGDGRIDENGNLFTSCSPTSGHYEEALAQHFWE